MNYRHSFRVRAPLVRVAQFHSRAASMAAITPPPIIARIHQAPAVLNEGDEMSFTLWLGPLPLRWLARIEAVSAEGFTDRLLRGPFAEWVHRHSFKPVDDYTTEVVDEIAIKLSSHPFWRLVGVGMRLGLPLLFAYRAWKTKRILQ